MRLESFQAEIQPLLKRQTQRMEEFLPGAGLSFLIAQSADPVASELASVSNKGT